ncbi:hypothetical protein CK203_103956 [Vitis vinifera]|uniref:Uncharacterized protein n=1 Tax=Vitis vinifera TaxID=29760 RepID=A0A438FIN5_VITVI|nr:hypothetical protein CK203_103956 [Vitis vinifera]
MGGNGVSDLHFTSFLSVLMHGAPLHGDGLGKDAQYLKQIRATDLVCEKEGRVEIRLKMNVPNLTLPIPHITINIVEMNWQEQRNFMFIESSAFINNVQQPSFMPTYLTAILALVAFFVPALLDLIDLKFQKEGNSVFEAHPATTMMAFATLLAFVLAFGIDFTFRSSQFSPICAALLRHCHDVFWFPLIGFIGITIVT